jgi:membrane-associated protease RseP (regulator of RpoE activity)
MLDWYTISVLVFVAILALIFYRDRKKVTRQSIMLIRKTQRGKKKLIRIGTGFPRFWKVLGTAGVVLCFAMSAYIFYFLIELIGSNILTGGHLPGLSLVLPAPGAEATVVPGAVLVPFWYWIIAIALLVIVHEGLHGIMAAMEKVRIKSMGWGLLLIIPLAFVEPDEKQLARKRAWPQLRVFAAGSFANFMLAGVVLLIGFLVSTSTVHTAGVYYGGLIAGYPAEEANLSGVIVGINDYAVRDINDLGAVLDEIGENQSVTIRTINGGGEQSFVLTTAGEPELDFSPPFNFFMLAGLEHRVTGSIDFSVSTLISDGNKWAELNKRISVWRWAADTYPDMQERADSRIGELESMLRDYKRPGFIGISSVSTFTAVNPGLEPFADGIGFLQGLLFWLFLINFGVGAANLMPIGPLDGGRMWSIFLKRVAKKRWKKISAVLSYLTLALFLLNFAFWFVF